MSAVTVAEQKLAAADVRKIVVSDIVEESEGSFVRAVSFFGDPIVNNAPTLLLTVTSRSENRADLVVGTPASGF